MKLTLIFPVDVDSVFATKILFGGNPFLEKLPYAFKSLLHSCKGIKILVVMVCIIIFLLRVW